MDWKDRIEKLFSQRWGNETPEPKTAKQSDDASKLLSFCSEAVLPAIHEVDRSFKYPVSLTIGLKDYGLEVRAYFGQRGTEWTPTYVVTSDGRIREHFGGPEQPPDATTEQLRGWVVSSIVEKMERSS
jgi:hypothetical protein